MESKISLTSVDNENLSIDQTVILDKTEIEKLIANLCECSDSDEDEMLRELKLDFYSDLEKLPHVNEHINRLKYLILRQHSNLKKIYCKLKDHGLRSISETSDFSTQTDLDLQCSDIDKNVDSKNVDEINIEQGFKYEPTSGLYYHQASGYYYDPGLRMYYDGANGKYITYDEKTKEYQYQEPAQASEQVSNNNSSDEVKTRKNKRKRECEEDTEEGEISSTSSECSDGIENSCEPAMVQGDEDISSGWPPCLRLTILETAIPKLTVGQLFIITCDGGDIGREGDRSVILQESSVSKVHLRISYCNEAYHVVDVGSRNGTWLNGKRLSVALQESEPHEINHGDILKVGSTTLSIHIHPGSETCDSCEPGLLIEAETPAPLPVSVSHRKAMRDLKKRLGLTNKAPTDADSAGDYKDRADQRRKTVGSSHPAEKTETACITRPIGAENKGFKMLEKMGWSSGQRLGANNEGLQEPVPIVGNTGFTGLGAAAVPCLSFNNKALKKKMIMATTRERFEELAGTESEVDKFLE